MFRSLSSIFYKAPIRAAQDAGKATLNKGFSLMLQGTKQDMKVEDFISGCKQAYYVMAKMKESNADSMTPDKFKDLPLTDNFVERSLTRFQASCSDEILDTYLSDVNIHLANGTPACEVTFSVKVTPNDYFGEIYEKVLKCLVVPGVPSDEDDVSPQKRAYATALCLLIRNEPKLMKRITTQIEAGETIRLTTGRVLALNLLSMGSASEVPVVYRRWGFVCPTADSKFADSWSLHYSVDDGDLISRKDKFYHSESTVPL
eukprot:TRINITY_DN11292_c0_g1_i1.p1 TRINITY_DN11292_c0_g1~~TRINITY_DN11292_c0_g1_i1.p1  ORF type:complete len:280 (+),score=34.36 TRINITY_DN11292_c0_g1_i1:66-842(+)